MAAPEAPPEAPSPDPTPIAAPTPADVQAESPDVGEDTPVEDAAPPESEPSAPPISAASIEELAEHEAVKPWLDERLSEARKEGTRDIRKRVQPEYQKRVAHWAESRQQATAFFNQLARDRKDGAVDYDALLDSHSAPLTKLAEAISGENYFHGIDWLGRELISDEDARDDFRERLTLMQGDPSADWSDLLGIVRESLTGTAVKDAVAKARAKWEKDELPKLRKTVELEVAAKARQNGSPPAEVQAGGGNSRGKAYKDMTAQERAALSPSQRDALLARIS